MKLDSVAVGSHNNKESNEANNSNDERKSINGGFVRTRRTFCFLFWGSLFGHVYRIVKKLNRCQEEEK